jgi:multiple sugar transport system permease protein
MLNLGPHLLPERFTLENYIYLFKLEMFPRWLFNSIFIPTIAVLLVCGSASMSGYVLAKRDFPGSKIIFFLMLSTMAIPRLSIILPLFMLMRSLKLINTYPSMFLIYMAWPFGVFLMKQTIKTIPNEIVESGVIDGASEWQIYWHLILPLVRPALIALGIFTFVACYNDYFWHLLMVRDVSMKTLPLAAGTFVADKLTPKTQLMMAVGFIATVPLFVLYFIFCKHFVKGASLGSVKG